MSYEGLREREEIVIGFLGTEHLDRADEIQVRRAVHACLEGRACGECTLAPRAI